MNLEATVFTLHEAAAVLASAGGKGANLTRLVRAGLPVPPGFIITTAAYQAFVSSNRLDTVITCALTGLRADDPTALTAASETIRGRFATGVLSAGLAQEIRQAYAGLGRPPVAVRSSATAEDLPDLSFAGQQDTYLNIIGDEALLAAVINCWSSLWTARAIGYRARNGIDQQSVALAVVVQEMVASTASGVLFTANPLNGKRREVVIDAILGLGEALVSGQVEPDHYVVDAQGRLTSKTLGAKALAIHGQPGGGTVTTPNDASQRQALPDPVISELASLGRRVESLFGAPQDIEWGWADGRLWLLQARPITSLFPLPASFPAEPLRAFVSFGAVQGMLDPITPLGRDFFLSFVTYVAQAFAIHVTNQTQQALAEASERLFINITGALKNRTTRALMPAILGVIEPGTREALETVLSDPRLLPDKQGFSLRTRWYIVRFLAPLLRTVLINLARPDHGRVATQQFTERMIANFEAQAQAATSLSARVALVETMPRLLPEVFMPYLVPSVASGVIPLRLLNALAHDIPGGAELVLTATRGLPYNVTTEMDLALWATAQQIKTDAAAAAAFAEADVAALVTAYQAGELPPVVQTALSAFLQRYGMRGVAEIDIGRPRWREDPAQIMQVVQSYLNIADPSQAPDVVFQRGAVAAEAAIERLTQAIRHGKRGWLKARLARAAARRIRALAGLRETPKFTIVRTWGIVRQALLDSGRTLTAAGILDQPDDLFFLTTAELRQLASGARRAWKPLAAARRAVWLREKQRRQVPRLLLSDGQVFYDGMGASNTDGAITGSPVSPGVVEGIVHVVLDPRGAQLAPGEILVCLGTDPAWTPLFLAAGGLVMEVGGLMTHGSVVAREYGIPAVVGVHEATTRLRSGQRIRVDGSAGRITVLTP